MDVHDRFDGSSKLCPVIMLPKNIIIDPFCKGLSAFGQPQYLSH